MTRIPCGRTLGHGERCCEGHLCDQCEERTKLRKKLRRGEMKTIWDDIEKIRVLLLTEPAGWYYVGRELMAIQEKFNEIIEILNSINKKKGNR
jgi:hypothetical protein